MRILITAILSEDGYEVIEAADGTSALVLVENETPDLAVLDLHLPDISGLEIATLFHQRIPFLVLTMDDEREYIDRCINLGALGYVLKPPDTEGGFLRQIRIAIERGRENLNLRRALEETQCISKALGILMGYHGITDEAAYKRLLCLSTSQKRRVADLAGEIVSASLQLAELKATVADSNKAIDEAIALLGKFK